MVRLQDVYEVYEKWLHIEDTKRIDVVLATALTRGLEGTKLWLILIGASGDWKTEQLNALDDGGYMTKTLSRITPRTLVSGHPKVTDLAPQLHNKLVLIPDFASLLKLSPQDKGLVWAQLRDLYDGYARAVSGSGKDSEYKNLDVTLIGASTPVIDTQILIHQDLGTRELLWRTQGNVELKELLVKIDENEEVELDMRLELKKITQKFLNSIRYTPIKLSDETKNKLFAYSEYIRLMRATAEFDIQSGDLINMVYPEEPTRIYKQLKRMYIALRSLDPDYPDERAFEIIEHLAESSSHQLRTKVFKVLIKNNRISTNTVAKKLKIGYKTAYKQLNTLWNLKIVDKHEIYLDETKPWQNPIYEWEVKKEWTDEKIKQEKLAVEEEDVEE